MKDYSDTNLIQALKQNNSKAFTEIYNRYWDKTFTVAANKLGDIFQAQELVQELFLDIWKRRESLSVLDHLDRYLATALKYKIINLRRKRIIEQKYILHSKTHDAGAYYSLEQQLQFEELKSRLEKLVTSLPKKCKLVYKLSREEGLAQKDIAARLGIAEKTVEAHLTRALKVLKSGIQYLFYLLF